MIPSVEQLRGWSEDMGDGWVRLPASAWDSVLWILGICEVLEAQDEIAEIVARAAAAGEDASR